MLCGDRALSQVPSQHATGAVPTGKTLLKCFITFHLVCLGWLLFRATNIAQAWDMLYLICTDMRRTPFAEYEAVLIAFYAIPLMIYELWLLRRRDLDSLVKVAWPVRAAIYSYATIMIVFFHPAISHEFIYFQF